MKGFYRWASCIVMFCVSTAALGQATGDYRSYAAGDWSDANAWERFDGLAWVHPAPSAPTSGDGIITIVHAITVPNAYSVTVDQVFVDIGGSLDVAAGGTLTVAEGAGTDLEFFNDGLDYGLLNVDGTLVCNDLATIAGTDQANATFSGGAVYKHLYKVTEGSIPVANWASTSRVEISGYTLSANLAATPAGNWSQQFGDLYFDCPLVSPRVFDFAGLLTNIAGELRIISTGAGRVQLSTNQNPAILIGTDFSILGTSRVVFATTGTNTQITVGRDFVYNSTNASGSQTNTTGSTTVTITRDFKMGAGSGQFILSSGTGAGAGTLKINGNFELSSGTLTETGSGVGTLEFVGSATHLFTNAGAISNTINYSVAASSTLSVGAYALTGAGSFTLNGTLQVGSTASAGAIQANTTGGNLLTPVAQRSFAPGSRIVYNGTAAQFTGDGHPVTAGVHTTIDNAAGVTLAANLTITGNLTLAPNSGNLRLGGFTLTMEGAFTPNGKFLEVGSTSSIAINGTGAFGTLSTTGLTMKDLTINRTSTGTVTLGSTVAIGGTLTQTDGDLILNGQTLTISGVYSRTAGNMVIDANASVVIDGTGTLSPISFSGTALNTFTLNRAATTVSTGASFTVTNLNLTSGTFDNTGTITIASGGTVSRSAQGTMSTAPAAAASYNVVYNIGNDINTGVELPTGTTQLNNLTKDGSAVLTLSSPITVNGVLTFTSGTFNSGMHALDIKGNVVSNATSQLASSPITFSGTTTLSGGTALTFGSVTISGTLTPSVNYQVNGDLANNGTLNAGTVTTTFGGTTSISGSAESSFNHLIINASSTLTAPTGNMRVAGNFTNNGTFNRNSGTVVFNGTTSIGGTSVTDFAGITISGTLNAPATLNLTRNFTNNGVFNRGSGTVVFKGTAKQTIGGTAVTEFNNINVTNTAGPPAVEVVTNQNLRGILTLSANSIFDADGTGTAVFTLVSSNDDPTSDASIATLPTGASVTGNVTVQRYMSIEGSTSRIYRYISSPVQSAPVSQIQSEIPVTGTFTGSSVCSGCGTTQSMHAYNETVITGDMNAGYIDFPDAANTESLVTGRGYAIFVRGNVEPVLSAGSARWDVRAPINSGAVTFPSTFTSSGTAANDGWNLVGNPYPSTIDWDAASGWTRNNINNAIYMRDNASGVVASYVGGVGTNGGSRYIPMGQGFFVQATGTPTFSCTESVKTAGAQSTFFRVAPTKDILRVALKKGSVRDETIIRFVDTATDGFDGDWDAHKLKNETFNISSLAAGNLKVAINTLPEITCGTTVNLDINQAVAGAYEMEFSQFDSFSDEMEIFVYDAFTDTRLNVKEVSSYAFEITSDTLSFGTRRFNVSFAYKSPVEASLDVTSEVCQGQEATISILNSEPYVSYAIFRGGVAITDAVTGNGGMLQIPVNGSLLASGANEFQLQYSPASCKSIVTSNLIEINSLTIPEITTVEGTHCGSGSVELNASGGVDGNYRWYESETDEAPIFGASASVYHTPTLNKSKTYYVSAVNALGCEGERKPVAAVIHLYDDVAITVDEDQNMLTSSYDVGNQWFYNGEPITGATGKMLEASESGLFEVEVTVNGCTTRASREMIIAGVEESLGKAIRIFPNPVKEKFFIELRDTDASARATVYTSMGKLVGEVHLARDGKKLRGEFQFEGQPAGMYLVKIVQGARIIHYTIIKK